ncbi:hypothetical protein NDU88_010595, partial [Pleurodeles waltl]
GSQFIDLEKMKGTGPRSCDRSDTPGYQQGGCVALRNLIPPETTDPDTSPE